ncbi:hypothetical protein ABFS82_03G023100 [Erythranthe guttata]|uniref:C2H2-type domain-containing protein n=1 Tax=Erythranthe guttata TaxID=4155 RepID=A0A022QLN2_ERYGU|nr:PREDICTED: uncharacterized protein LOC105966652 [Erythranthe guttata]EYU29612.1 hypothetical protein MIMGU_mgv1a000338mg [Erythranthe guttata]|eukprot:XP_012846699.1 PREDICTED: uncharacterized protein LOC105966652 [Erythranthe guttata]
MVSVTATTTTADGGGGGGLKLDSIPIVDLRLLSQSELYSLSLCSSSAFDPCRRDDVVIPNIDRSVFNESAGSRKQTYSRLRLAPPSSSSSAAPRRRTPHLRSSAASLANAIDNNNSDPENVENAQIVTLLKQLFVTDVNYEELVPVKIDYSNSLPPQLVPVRIDYSNSLPHRQFSPFPSSNVGPTGQKRKRGRPRKNQLLGRDEDSATRANVVNVDEANGFSSLNEIVVHENAEERDREVVNKDGVAVDLVALGMVEHPYGEEIRRRTQGMLTEDELLGFLKGLNGSWGSRRKKKRIVDANEFGSVLPVGWKLLLSIRKQHGQAWLYCRRYISPSGLYFVSCKGVSSYMCSLYGIQDTNTDSLAQSNGTVNDADNLTSVMIADPAVQGDERKENMVPRASSPTSGSISGNHEVQAVINAGDLPQDRRGENLYCNKCNITFSEKDQLLQHQSSVHRKNRCKSGMRITDGVIIKDGKYECQFCHKTFDERHRYNGHVGAHVRYQAKTAGESPLQSGDPVSFDQFPIRDTTIEGSLMSNNNVQICNTITSNKDIEHVGDVKEANVGVATDMVTNENPCSVAEVLCSNDEAKSFHEDARVKGSAVEITDDGSSLPLDASLHGVMNGTAFENSTCTEKPEQREVFNRSLFDSDGPVEECEVVVNNQPICQTSNDIKLDYKNFAVNGSALDFSGRYGEQDGDLSRSIKQQSNFESMPSKNIGTSDSTSTFKSMASELTKDPKTIMLPVAHEEKECLVDNLTCSIGERIETCENGSSIACDDGVSRQVQFGMSSAIPTWDRLENMSGKDDAEALTCVLKQPGVNTSERRSADLSGNQIMYGYEKNSEEVCGRKMEAHAFDDFRNLGNVESSDPFRSNHAVLNSNSVGGNEQRRELGDCPDFTSATDKRFFTEDNMISIFNDAFGQNKQDPSGVSEGCHEAYTSSKIYGTPANPSGLGEIEDIGKYGLSLSFDNRQTEFCTDSNRVDQERYQADSVNTQSALRKTYGDQTHLNITNSSTPGDLKQGRSFGIDFPDSSFNITTSELGSGFNQVRDWSGQTRGKMAATSGQNFMIGFQNNSSQSGECVTAGGSWRTGQENLFQGCFDAPVGQQQVPASSCFHNFDITSDKGEEESPFSLNKKYDFHTDMLRPGRPEPVEYSFMGEQSSNTLSGESKIFSSFSENMDQGLDHSFWLGKDDLMPNASQTTSVCVWCRNIFFQDTVQSGIQTGAIGTMCPSCSTRIPGQF